MRAVENHGLAMSFRRAEGRTCIVCSGLEVEVAAFDTTCCLSLVERGELLTICAAMKYGKAQRLETVWAAHYLAVTTQRVVCYSMS